MYGDYPTERKRDRGNDPYVSIYIINDHSGEMQKLSCIFCKRTIADQKGRIDKIIDTPIDPKDFGTATNIRCKLCHQNYRLIAGSSYIGVAE